MQQFCMCSMLSGKNFTLTCGSPGNSPTFDINPLTSYGCMSPPGEDPQGDGISPFSSQVQEIWIDWKKHFSADNIMCTGQNQASWRWLTVDCSLAKQWWWQHSKQVRINTTKFEKCKFIFIKTFSLPLPSSLLKLPNAWKWTGGGGMGTAENWLMHIVRFSVWSSRS